MFFLLQKLHLFFFICETTWISLCFLSSCFVSLKANKYLNICSILFHKKMSYFATERTPDQEMQYAIVRVEIISSWWKNLIFITKGWDVSFSVLEMYSCIFGFMYHWYQHIWLFWDGCGYLYKNAVSFLVSTLRVYCLIVFLKLWSISMPSVRKWTGSGVIIIYYYLYIPRGLTQKRLTCQNVHYLLKFSERLKTSGRWSR